MEFEKKERHSSTQDHYFISMGLSAIIIIECRSAETRGVASLVNGFFLQVSLVATSVLVMPFFLGNTRLWEVLFLFEIFNDSYQCSHNKKQNLVTLWKCRFSARGTLLGMLIMGAMAQSGITIINFYAVRILVATGLNGTNASIANSLLCLFAVAGITTAFFIVDKNSILKEESICGWSLLVFYEEAIEAVVVVLKQQGAPLAVSF
ncbi:hypothetical protein B9Z55_026737 [Caenorhabditis nigoni]|uniref:Uncharacterized protein n=2 Tax=Caenorhabditis nigoni TaxID=1611254 RepID=A0A2G5SHM4_9PELO|nr:hypothetical protein B9Z55_026737 [Caenorhabditis nigoni]